MDNINKREIILDKYSNSFNKVTEEVPWLFKRKL